MRQLSVAHCILVFLILVIIFENVVTFERKLNTVKLKCDNVSYTHCDKLVIVEAISAGDTLYYLWDFGKKPTFLIARLPLGSNITVDLNRFARYENGSVQFTFSPSLIFGSVLNKLYEYDVSGEKSTVSYNSEDFHWNVTELVDAVTEDRVMFSSTGRLDNNSNAGFLNIVVSAYGKEGTAVHIPHLLHSSNSSQIDIVLDNFHTSFEYSRFAVELIIFSSIKNSKDNFVAQKTLDDENTPGVFILDKLSVTREQDGNASSGSNAYLQWRPVVYTTSEMVVTSSVRTEESIKDMVHNNTFFNGSLLYAVYGHLVSDLFVKALNISFGLKVDKFYGITHYSSWSFVLGVGDEPGLPYSLTVLFLIFIAVGLPIVITIIWIAFFIYRKVKRS